MEAMLPPLSPLTVVKAPLLRDRPQERRSVGNQEMLLTLLNKQRKKYLARIKDYSSVEGEKSETEKKNYDLIPPSLYSDESSIKSFAEHVIKCAKRRRKKSIRSQRRIGRNGTITSLAAAATKAEQKSSTDQTQPGRCMVQDKLSSPMKQEIRTMYRLKLTKHDADSEQLEVDSSNRNQDWYKKPAMSSPMASSPSAQGFNGSPHNNNSGNSVRRKLTFLSERQSEMSSTIGAPNPPPGTPNNAEWNRFYIPSLHDIKSQRLLKSRLLAIETSVREKQAKERDKEIESKKKKELEELTKLREMQKETQRNEIYALNKIMAALEEAKMSSFITEKV